MSTPNFSLDIELWPAAERKQQDVYFQPALTWLLGQGASEGATQGVALLMLEYDPSSADASKQDFRELTKGLIRWTWAAAGKAADVAVTVDDLDDLYDDFSGATLAHADLQKFLAAHYAFVMHEFAAPGGGAEVDATVFPMFPDLELAVGGGAAQSFSSTSVTPSELDDLRDYFQQLQAQFGRTTKANTIGASSIAEFIFVGYARLLIRAGIQAGSDTLEAGGGSAANITALVDSISNSDYFNIAQMASRFLLHGFNLPEGVISGEVASADEGLYVSTRQQYVFADSLSSGNYVVKLRMGATSHEHITFPSTDDDGRGAITYSIASSDESSLLLAQAKALDSLKTTDLASLHSVKPTRMDPYRRERLHFVLRNRVQWEHGGDAAYLLPLSASLRAHLRCKDPNPTVDLLVWPGGQAAAEIDVANADFAWATRLELTLAQLPDPQTDESLTTVFELGESSEEHKLLLEGVWDFLARQTDASAIDLTLLYVSGSGTTNPGVTTLATVDDDVLVVKANLSNDTGAVDSGPFGAALSDKQTFLQLIWEGLDVSGGGYYLHLPKISGDARAKIFSDGTSGIIQLLIGFTDAADPIHDFNNCAIFDQAIDVENDLVLARSTETVPVLTVPAGYLGFEISDRPELEVPDPDTGVDELSALYQLLGYQIQASPPFIASNVGLPIGPAEHETPNGNWLYERLVPTFSLVPRVDEIDGAPDPNLDPYRSMDGSSELVVDTWWQDIYGNQLLDNKNTEAFAVGYTDPLLGINQWPSVAERYALTSTQEGRRLNLSFSFDASSYYEDGDTTKTRDNRMASDRAIVESAYYQLSQSDVTLKLTTSLDSNWSSADVDKNELLEFLLGIYQFLGDPTQPAPAPFTQAIDASGIAVAGVFIQEVQVELEMSRALDHVLEDLRSNGAIKDEHRNVLTSVARLSPMYEANSVTVAADQTPAQIASAALRYPVLVYTAADVLAAVASRAEVLSANLSLDPAALVVERDLLRISTTDWDEYVALSPAPITTQTEDTCQTLATKFGDDMSDKLGRDVEFSVTDLGAILARVSGLLVAGAQFQIGIRAFTRAFQETFESEGLHLAVSGAGDSAISAAAASQLLCAVRFDDQGITFDIEQRPTYFGLPPLSNSLLTGLVALDDYAGWKGGVAADADLGSVAYTATSEDKKFEAIDINVLARAFLVAVEEFLEPSRLVPAKRLLPDKVASILQRKAELARALSEDLQPILKRDVGAVASEAEDEAKAALRQELLIDLVKGYDVETVVQYGVNVTVANPSFDEARIRGKAKVLGAQVGEGSELETIPLRDLERVLDFTLSAGKIKLRGGDAQPASYFTYLFDTKNPELLASVVLDLEFAPIEIEHDIQQLTGIADYESSRWLSLILPDDLRQPLGASPIPIPLRSYPQPPSLVQQSADADTTSLTDLEDVRQWEYTIVVEHPYISQDSVDCILQLNVPAIDNLPTESGTIAQPSALFSSLVNFSQIFPQLSQDLDALEDAEVLTDDAKSRQAKLALIALEALVQQTTRDWQAWVTGINIYGPGDGDLHFELRERPGASDDERVGEVDIVKTVASIVGDDSIFPVLQLPGYDRTSLTRAGVAIDTNASLSDGDSLVYEFQRDATDLTFFGDSSIPDRMLTVLNLDVIEHQNAWASVWLSRNKVLIEEANGAEIPTNPAFVFQTPAVRFNNMVTPFITNDEPWELATLKSDTGDPVERTLKDHLQTMIDVLFPAFEASKYEVRLSCRYSFAMVRARGFNEDIVTTLPILLGLRVTPQALAAGYAGDLSAEISRWLTANRPSMENASLSFVVDLFSKLDPDSNTSLPMLRITRLGLSFSYVSDVDSLIA